MGMLIAGALALSGIAASIVSAVVNIVLSIGLGMLQKLMTKKPKSANVGSEQTITVRQPNAPWQVIYGVTRVSGVYFFVHTTAQNSNLQLGIALAGHEVQEIADIYFDDEVVPIDPLTGAVTTGKYANHAAVWKYLGGGDQLAATDRLDNAKWTTDHRLRNRAYIIVHLNYNVDIFPNGVPNITAIVYGRKLYDPRTDTTYWTDNAAMCLADYLNNPTFGLGAAYGDEIDLDVLSAAANICDELVPLAAGGNEARYTVNGKFTTDAKPVDIIADMANAMAGSAYHIGGRWRIKAGGWQVPSITFDESDLRGPIRVQSLITRRENFNGVKGQYISPLNKYQETDFPAVASDTFMAQDGGERVWNDIKLPFTITASMAQRLAKIALLRCRQPVTMTAVPYKLSAYRAQAGDVIMQDNTRFGWSGKYFEITSATLAIETQNDAPHLGVNFDFRETDPSVYDWSTSEEQAVDPAPNTNLPDAFNVVAPGGLGIVEEIYVTRDGAGVKTLARLSWVASPDAFVTRYEVQYQEVGATDWSTARETTATALEIFDLAPGTYDFRVRSVSVLGVRSDWVTARAQLSGLLDPPTEPQDLTIQTIAGLAVLSWQQSQDLDVRIGGRIEFRHSPDIGGTATWMASTSIGLAVPGSTTMTVLPLKAGTYLAKAVDSSGIYSTNAATVESEQATALAFGPVDSITEEPAFSGAKSGVFLDADDGTLKLGGGDDVDDWGAVDSITDWDSEGGVRSSGTYTFSAGIDLGSVKSVRITGHIAALVINVLDQLDSRTGNVDDWVDWDGTQAASADAWNEVRKTNDNPAGSPAWTAWQRLDAHEVTGRGLQFRTQFVSGDPAYNIRVSELSVAVEEVV